MPKRAIRVACTMLALVQGACMGPVRSRVSPTFSQQELTRADSLRITSVREGVRYMFAWEQEGPWAIHVLEVRSPCTPVWQARKSGTTLGGRATTSALAFGALAAVNGDFFALPLGTPVGAHVQSSEVLISPADRPVAVGFAGQRSWIDQARLDAQLTSRAGNTSIAQINRARRADATPAVRLFTHWFGPSAPADTAVISARVRLLGSDRGSDRGIVELVDSAGNAIWLDTTHVVVHAPRTVTLGEGDTLRWSARVVPASAAPFATELIGGFPWLVRAGQNVLAQQPGLRPDFAERRHPRTAVAFTQDGSTLLVVVDGRQPGYSDGMTLPELADFLLRLGARDALNLDGGGSSALVIRSRLMNRPSDSEGERAVGNALTLARCR